MKETKREFAKKVVFWFVGFCTLVTFFLALGSESPNLTQSVPYLIYLCLASPLLAESQTKKRGFLNLAICVFSAFMMTINFMIGATENYLAFVIWLIIFLLYFE